MLFRSQQLIDDFAVGAPNRMRMWLNIAELGNYPGGIAEFLDGIGPAKVDLCRAAAEKHKQWVIGIKARLSRSISKDLDVEILTRAIAAAGKLPVMIHVGDTASPLPKLLAMLRPGDVVTHMYAPNPHGILDDNGKLLPEVIAARKRGIHFDFGNGRTEHWHWEVAEKAIAQGFVPDTISSDLEILGSTEQEIGRAHV